MKQPVKSYQEDFRVGSELDSLIQNFEETPFGDISDDTTTEGLIALLHWQLARSF